MSNLNYDNLIEASHFSSVLRRLGMEARPLDKVESMMFEYMIKYLERIRNSLLSQGLNGINPGFDTGQTNPNQLVNDVTTKESS